MKRILITALVFLATASVSGIATSPAAAIECRRVAVPGTGQFRHRFDDECLEKVPPNPGPAEWIYTVNLGKSLGSDEYCAEVAEAGTGRYSNSNCEGTEEAEGKYIRVVEVKEGEAPFWTVGGARLAKGQTRFIKTKEVKPFVLTAAGVALTCEETSVTKGAVLLGSEPGEPGTGDGVATFGKCKVEGNGTGSECSKVTEPITTTNLKSELVLDKTKVKLLTLFQPVSGSLLATLTFPKGCKVESTKVTGSVNAEVLNSKEEAITTSSPAVEEASGLLAFPATQPVHVWLIKGGKGEEIETKALEAFGSVATLSGRALVSLESGENWSALA
jgi:hypothetical protein